MAQIRRHPSKTNPKKLVASLSYRAGKPLLFVINRVKPRARLTADAAVALSQHGAVAPAFIYDRVDYAGAKIDGHTAPELEPGGRAAAEVAALWDFIANRMGVTDGEARDDGQHDTDQGGIGPYPSGWRQHPPSPRSCR